jgi:Na+/H+-dicarboxylate symporter
MTEVRARVGRVFLALVAGLIVGTVLGATSTGAAAAITGILSPIGALWINAVRMTVVPLVVSLLFVSVANAGGGRALAREGTAAFAAFAGLLVLAAVATCVIGPSLVGQMPASVAAAALQSQARQAAPAASVPGFTDWLGSLVPTNVVRAAADGAMLPLVVFVLLFALAARQIAADRREALVGFFAAIGSTMTTVVGWVIALAPIGVFALVVGPASHNGASFAGAIGYYVVAISLLLVLFTMLLYPIAQLTGTPPAIFARGVFPAQAVALASSSSLASLPALVEGSARIGIPSSVAGFSLPLAVSTFKVSTPISWGVGSLFLARLYGISLSPWTVIGMSLAAVAASFSIPGVPQGAILMMAPFLTTFGIPAEGVALLIAADTIPDLFATMTNVTADMVAATIVARAASAGSDAGAAADQDSAAGADPDRGEIAADDAASVL